MVSDCSLQSTVFNIANSLKSSLESLSPELKFMVLDNISDLETLRNIVRASPDFHATYLSAKDVFLSRIIFNDRLDWGDDEGEPLMTEALIEVDHVIPGRHVSDEVKTTLRQIRRHQLGIEKLRTLNGEIVLNYEQCLALLTVRHLGWKEESTATYIEGVPCGTTKLRYQDGFQPKQSARLSSTPRPPLLGFDSDWSESPKTYFIYLDDIRDGYERLDVKFYRWYRHLSVFCPKTNKWRDWIASEDHARCVRQCYCD